MRSCGVLREAGSRVGARIGRIRECFRGRPDARKGDNNQSDTREDAALSACAVFFTQSAAILDDQVRMQKARGRNNAASLCGVHGIRRDQQTRNLLDPVPPEHLAPLLIDTVEELYRRGGSGPDVDTSSENSR